MEFSPTFGLFFFARISKYAAKGLVLMFLVVVVAYFTAELLDFGGNAPHEKKKVIHLLSPIMP